MKVVIPSEKDVVDFFAPQREILSQAEILETIEPVDPDRVIHLGDGVYEARWQDGEEAAREIARLANMNLARVVVISQSPYRPEGLPTSLAVKFCIIPLPVQTSDEVQ